MSTYLVTFDLFRPDEDYSGIGRALRQMDAAEVLDSVWLLRSDFNAGDIREAVKGACERGDRLLIAEVTADWATWNAPQAGNVLSAMVG